MPKDAVGNWEDCVGQILSVADSIKLTIQDIEAVLGGDTTKVHDLVTNISGFAKALVGLPGACLKTDIGNAGGCSDDLNQIGSQVIELTRYIVEMMKRGDVSKVDDIISTAKSIVELGKLAVQDCL